MQWQFGTCIRNNITSVSAPMVFLSGYGRRSMHTLHCLGMSKMESKANVVKPITALNLSKKVTEAGRPRFGFFLFRYGLAVERFERFRFSVPAVPLQKGLAAISDMPSAQGSGDGVPPRTGCWDEACSFLRDWNTHF